MKDILRYRNCTITQNYITKSGKPRGDSFKWEHDETDGAEDGNRWCGYAATLQEAIEDIDEKADEYLSWLTELEQILEKKTWRTTF